MVCLARARVIALICGLSIFKINFEMLELTCGLDNRNVGCGKEFSMLHTLATICPLDAAAPSKNV